MFDNISLSNMGWTVFNLLVLFLLLKKFLFAPVTKMMEDRQSAIAAALENADDQNRAAQERLAGCDAQIQAARDQAGQIVAQARVQAQRAYDATLAEAQAEAGRMMEQARAQMERERLQLRDGVRAELGQLVLLATARLAADRPDPQADQALVEAFLAQAGERHG